MNPDALRLHSDGEDLLLELARDPRSELLRLPRTRSLPDFFRFDQALSIQRAGLLSAERELLRVHREEVAALLLEAATHKLLTQPNPKYHYSKFKSPDELRPPLELPRWRERAEFARAFDATPRTRDHLGAWITLPIEHWPSTLELARIAFTFVPSDRARILAALGLVDQDQPRTAERILGDVIDRRRVGPLAANAWANLGLARAVGEDVPGALVANRTAAMLDEPTLAPAFNWLLNSLFLDDDRESNRAAQWLRLAGGAAERASDDFAQRQKPLVERTLMTRNCARHRNQVRSEAWCESARRVLHVFPD